MPSSRNVEEFFKKLMTSNVWYSVFPLVGLHLLYSFHKDSIRTFAWSCQQTNRQRQTDRQTDRRTNRQTPWHYLTSLAEIKKSKTWVLCEDVACHIWPCIKHRMVQQMLYCSTNGATSEKTATAKGNRQVKSCFLLIARETNIKFQYGHEQNDHLLFVFYSMSYRPYC